MPPSPRDPNEAAKLIVLTDLASAEASLFQVIWNKFREWATRLKGAVFGHRAAYGPSVTGPDPMAVFTTSQWWDDEVTAAVLPLVEEVWKDGYASIAGDVGHASVPDWEPDGQWGFRQAVQESRNRLVRVPDSVFSSIRAATMKAGTEGWSAPDLAARVEEILGDGGAESWRGRALTIARTEALSAYNGGKYSSFLAYAGSFGGPEGFEKIWLATHDHRTRFTHTQRGGGDLQRVPLLDNFVIGGAPLLYPGWPEGPPGEVINCVPGGAAISIQDARRAFRYWLDGSAVTLTTGDGRVRTVSTNHPVLTKSGWVPASQIEQGNHLVRSLVADRFTRAEPDVQRSHPTAEEVFDALALSGKAHGVRAGAVNFHGDRPDGEVQVVAADRPLSFGVDAASAEEFRQLAFASADAPAAGGGPAFHLGVTPASASRGGVSFGDLRRALLGAHAGPLSQLGGAPVASVDEQFVEPQGDHAPTHAEGARQGFDRFAGLVALDQVVKVEIVPFHGFLYTFETDSGTYVADSIISHNCRCSMLLVEPGESVDLSDRHTRSAQ